MIQIDQAKRAAARLCSQAASRPEIGSSNASGAKSTSRFNGAISEVRVWSTCRSEWELDRDRHARKLGLSRTSRDVGRWRVLMTM